LFTIAPLQHVREHRAHHAEGSVQRDVEHAAPLLVAHLDDPRRPAQARVVDQHVDPAQLGDRGVHERPDLRLARDVTEPCGRPRSQLSLQLVGRLAQTPLVDVADHHARALFRAAARGGEADSGARGRSDQHGLAGQEIAARGVRGKLAAHRRRDGIGSRLRRAASIARGPARGI